MEHFKHYLLGKNFTLETDHEALLLVFNRQGINREYSPQLIRWRYRLLPYNFEVLHTPGKETGITDYHCVATWGAMLNSEVIPCNKVTPSKLTCLDMQVDVTSVAATEVKSL